MTLRCYTLVDREVIELGNPLEQDTMLLMGAMLQDIDRRRVALTELPDGWSVSTVFIGIDHGIGDGPPLVFETMVFDDDGHSVDLYRWPTWAEAEQGHGWVLRELVAHAQ